MNHWLPRLLAGLLFVGPLQGGPAAAVKPNFVLIMADDLGWADVPGESRNLATEQPDVLAQMKERLVEVSGRDRDALATTNDPAQPASPQTASKPSRPLQRVFKDRVSPHWFANNSRFWYRNDLPDERKEFIMVDAQRGTREPAFDHARLAAALSQAVGAPLAPDRLPFDSIAPVEEPEAVAFRAEDSLWLCDLSTYQCAKTDRNIAFPAQTEDEPAATRRRGGRQRGGGDGGRSPDSDRSADGKWTAFVKDHNVFIRSNDEKAQEVQLSTDGRENLSYGLLAWAPDGQTLVAFRITPGERKEVHLVQSSPAEGGRAQLTTRPYALPGDRFTIYEVNLFDVESRRQTKPEVDRFEHEWLRPRLRWLKDGRHFAYSQTDRGHQRFRVLEIDSHTGQTRPLIDERSQTFIWTAHTENVPLERVNWLEQTEELIYASESNGWRHLYLIDTQKGQLKNCLTSGPWVVRGIDRIDETNRQVWFQASGVFPAQDPYLIHYGRVDFNGRGLVWLTAGDGNHRIEFSPDRRFLIDTYSRADTAPVTELRRTADGELVCRLEEADLTALKASGWHAPTVFVAKGRDGQTDIWGLLHFPPDFDPNKKYPVIEDIYAGPQGSFVPKSFSPASRYESLTRLGFIVVKIDGMGTANRSKAFHDVCWRNLKDAGFADRILWMKAAAAKYPSMDLTRVGIYGNSAGGQNAAGALLFHPEFYKVAVASCGCHDNRMDKASWNEQWMGYLPPDQLWSTGPENWYAQSSNIENAYRLRGKLFLIVGEMDNNVPPESTLRLVDALIKAGKDFDLLVVPNGGHGMGGAYGQRRMQDFFVRHLLGQDPPDHNVEELPAEGGRAGG